MEASSPPPALEPRQLRFCNEYLIDMNATAAARRAGYSVKSAHNTGCKLLKLQQVKDYLGEAQAQIATETAIAARVMGRELANMVFADPAEFVDEQGNIKNMADIPAHLRKAVQIQTRKVMVDGQVKVTTTYQLSNKIPIMEKLSNRIELKDALPEDRSNWPTAKMGDGSIQYI